MKPHTASLMNALVLMALSAWAYVGSETPSFTALIPAGFGVVMLVCYPGVKAENKIVSHIAVVLTLVLLLGLLLPLRGALGRGDNVAVFRVALMVLTTVVALVAFIKSFINVRRQRAAGGLKTGP